MNLKQTLLLNKVLWKQYLIKHNRWILALLVAALFLRFMGVSEKEEGFAGLTVGICAADEKGEELLERLQGIETERGTEKEGIFRFREYKEQETMLRDVKNGTLECGYVLPEGFFEKLAEGKLHNRIMLYYSGSSGAHKLSYEVVFSHLFGLLSEEILADWMEESGLAFPEKLLQMKENYEAGGDTFSFEFAYVGEDRQQTNAMVDSIRGMTSVSMFFLALLGLANCCELSVRTCGFAKREAKRLEYTGLHIAVIGSAVAGGLFSVIAGLGTQPVKELWGLIIYVVALEVFLFVLKQILRTREAVYSAIPVLLLGSILLCPVFFRIETYLPVLEYLGRVFPIYWYLDFLA